MSTPLRYNFILPANFEHCIPSNTLGLYIKALLEHCASIPSEVAFNGHVMTSPFTMCPPSQTKFKKRSTYIPQCFVDVLRDLRLSRPFYIPLHYFKKEFTNVLIINHKIKVPKHTDKYFIVGLLDEPPSLGDNFKIPIICYAVQRRFKKQLSRFQKFWVYHKVGENYLLSLDIKSPIITFPCVLDYSQLSVPKKTENPEVPLRIVMASSYQPWHGVPEMLQYLKPLLLQGKINITLIGNGPMREKTEFQALKIPEITFVDEMSYEEFKEFLQQFEFGILWKIPWFNSPLKLMDYARAQLGIITYETEAIQSIFPKNSYFSVEEFLMLISKGDGFKDYRIRLAAMNQFIETELNQQKLNLHLSEIRS